MPDKKKALKEAVEAIGVLREALEHYAPKHPMDQGRRAAEALKATAGWPQPEKHWSVREVSVGPTNAVHAVVGRDVIAWCIDAANAEKIVRALNDSEGAVTEDHDLVPGALAQRFKDERNMALAAFEDFIAEVSAPTGRLRFRAHDEGAVLYAAVKSARATLSALRSHQ